ncbi:MAG TPA: hypothetical protein VI338_05515 [Nitrososphaera sp.]|nr:hypothetical protein [Nitrososphaera sp.]
MAKLGSDLANSNKNRQEQGGSSEYFEQDLSSRWVHGHDFHPDLRSKGLCFAAIHPK